MAQPLLFATACLGACAVGMGAIGGHAMQAFLSDAQLATWETATRYLMWHVLAALVVAYSASASNRIGWLWLLGGALFSGSLYGWLLLGWRPLVFLTPIGGGIMILGWLALCIQALLAWTSRQERIHD